MLNKVAVIGAGSWGTALAVLLAKIGNDVHIYGRNKEKVSSFNCDRENTWYLPGIMLPSNIVATTSLEEATEGVKYIVMSVPSHMVREAAQNLKPYIASGAVVINVAKGIETGTLMRLSEVLAEELAGSDAEIAVLSGPSHAEEVSRDIPTAVVASARKRSVAEEVQDLFMSPGFRVYTNPDILGVELGGALKNVIALGTGIADGLGFGDNTTAALITRGAEEIARLGRAAGANTLTFAGLSGIGDLIVTCTSKHSRNRRTGYLIGNGVQLKEAVAEVGMVVEGVKATEAAHSLSRSYQVTMPICDEMYKVLFENKDPREAVISLMSREKKHEVEGILAADSSFSEW